MYIYVILYMHYFAAEENLFVGACSVYKASIGSSSGFMTATQLQTNATQRSLLQVLISSI